MNRENSLIKNAFYVLQVSVRDDRSAIIEAAEEQSLHRSQEECQKARANLTNPKLRLESEIAWLPGLAPKVALDSIEQIQKDQMRPFADFGAPGLARANLMSSGFEMMDPDFDLTVIAECICDFSNLVEALESEEILRDINEDRQISQFPEIKGIDQIEEALSLRKKHYRYVLKELLNRMKPERLIMLMATVVNKDTSFGNVNATGVISELCDAYELEVNEFLQKEIDAAYILIEKMRITAPSGRGALESLLNQLESVLKNYNKVALPVETMARSRGLETPQSRKLAFAVRSLGIDLNNEYNLTDIAQRITMTLKEVFSNLPEFSERVEEDAVALENLKAAAEEQEKEDEEWRREVTFRAEWGLLFKDELSIDPNGIHWKGETFPLESITKVRWGIVRNSINGIPTGSTYTIGFGDARRVREVNPNNEQIHAGFLNALWKGVCVRLMLSLVRQVKAGDVFNFGDIQVFDDGIELTRHRFLASNERVRLGWGDVRILSENGSFIIRSSNDSKVYGSASYLEHWNTHLIEHLIRVGFKKGINKLSECIS